MPENIAVLTEANSQMLGLFCTFVNFINIIIHMDEFHQ